jgi:hypothetical protein
MDVTPPVPLKALHGRSAYPVVVCTCAMLLAGLVSMLSLAPQVQGALADDQPADHTEILEAIAESPFEEPVHLVSLEGEDGVRGNIHALVDIPFAEMSETLIRIEAWCEILFLHINVKACVHQADENRLTLFLGRKRYQDPAVAEQIRFRFHVDRHEGERLMIRLQADRGPYGLRQVHMILEVLPLDGDSSLLHLEYALRYGRLGRMALAWYFAFAGRERIGFTVQGLDEEGKPVHVDGLQGMIERNTVRFSSR